ncbi:MAG: hypothetical protein ACRDWT_00055 [Jatrophihabitantaceae bacterium]
MTSATLYREAADLESLLADLDEQYPGRVRVVEVSHAREGGVFGFFARPKVGVHYELDDAAAGLAQPSRPVDRADTGLLAELLDAADAADAVTAAESAPGRLEGPNAEFAQLLLDLAARKAIERDGGSSSVRTLADPLTTTAPGIEAAFAFPDFQTDAAAFKPDAAASKPAAPVITAPPPVERRAEPHPDLTLRRKLAEIGVPIGWVPDAPHVYAAVETLVNSLPEAPALPSAPGQLIVAAGPAGIVVGVAAGIAKQLRLPEDCLWSAGCAGDQEITDSWRAGVAATAHRLSGDRPAVVAVATDTLDEGLAAEIITALQPDALWQHVDATRKPSDTRSMVREHGAPTALFVTGAARTASPASVWELGAPVALLDGRPPTRSSWAVLLLDKFADLEQ